ncbi:hypothetical protein P7C70_g8981, partial [Phenoliferia sp. Uapishka_3]
MLILAVKPGNYKPGTSISPDDELKVAGKDVQIQDRLPLTTYYNRFPGTSSTHPLLISSTSPSSSAQTSHQQPRAFSKLVPPQKKPKLNPPSSSTSSFKTPLPSAVPKIAPLKVFKKFQPPNSTTGTKLTPAQARKAEERAMAREVARKREEAAKSGASGGAGESDEIVLERDDDEGNGGKDAERAKRQKEKEGKENMKRVESAAKEGKRRPAQDADEDQEMASNSGSESESEAESGDLIIDDDEVPMPTPHHFPKKPLSTGAGGRGRLPLPWETNEPESREDAKEGKKKAKFIEIDSEEEADEE